MEGRMEGGEGREGDGGRERGGGGKEMEGGREVGERRRETEGATNWNTHLIFSSVTKATNCTLRQLPCIW